MRKWYAAGLGIASLSLWSCGDENAGPGVGPLTSWQIGIGEGGGGVAEDAHGPLSGYDEEDKSDDVKLRVECRRDAAGYQIEIEDPGENRDDRSPRARSVLEITNLVLDDDRCTVQVTEYNRSGSPLRFTDRCEGNSDPGSCTFDIEENSDGYDLNGTFACELMRAGSGRGMYTLRKARELDDPIDLQIVSCR